MAKAKKNKKFLIGMVSALLIVALVAAISWAFENSASHLSKVEAKSGSYINKPDGLKDRIFNEEDDDGWDPHDSDLNDNETDDVSELDD